MRPIIRFFAWLFALAASIRVGLSLYVAWLAATLDNVAWDISVEQFIANHVGVLHWAPDMARNILPDHFIEFIFGMPALVATPIGALVAAGISYLLFRLSRRG